jgi:hypothetical protein
LQYGFKRILDAITQRFKEKRRKEEKGIESDTTADKRLTPAVAGQAANPGWKRAGGKSVES